jgi:hypothetical protein
MAEKPTRFLFIWIVFVPQYVHGVPVRVVLVRRWVGGVGLREFWGRGAGGWASTGLSSAIFLIEEL